MPLEDAAFATIFPAAALTVIHTRAMLRLPSFWQLHSHFGDFSPGACHGLKITAAESNHGMGILTNTLF